VAVVLLDEAGDELRLAAHAGDPPSPAEELPVGVESLVARAIKSGAPQISGLDTETDSGNPAQHTVAALEAAIPVMWEGQAIGALRVRATSDAGFADDEIDALGWVASQAAAVLTVGDGHTQPASAPGTPAPVQRESTRPWRPDMGEGAIEYEFGDMEVPDSAPRIRVPLSLRDEEIGSISLAAEADWTAEEQGLVEAVATQAALALENARLMEASQLSASREHILAEITAKVWAGATLDGVLRTTVEALAQALGADRATIELRTDTGDGRRS
jgi:signal transduction protein with GAF and PtsI domain